MGFGGAEARNLVDPGKYCMAIIPRTLNGVTTHVVCGRLLEACTARRHVKAREEGQRGPIGVYKAYVDKHDKSTSDGVLSTCLKIGDHKEPGLAKGGENEPPMKNGNPKTPLKDTRTLKLKDPPKRPEDEEETPLTNNSTKEDGKSAKWTEQSTDKRRGLRFPGRNLDQEDLLISGPPVPTTAAATAEMWYCMTDPNGRRHITRVFSEYEHLQKVSGIILKDVMDSKKKALEWVHTVDLVAPEVISGLAADPKTTIRQTTTVVMEDDMSQGRGRTARDHKHREATQEPTSRELLDLINVNGHLMSRPDTSKGTEFIHGRDPANEEGMDRFLMPPGVDSEASKPMYEATLDATNLPGAYREMYEGANANESLGEALYTAINGNTQHPKYYRGSWEIPSHLSLARITSLNGLKQHKSRVREDLPAQVRAQQDRYRCILASFGYPEELAQQYSIYGALPRLVDGVVELYRDLLDTIEDMGTKMEIPNGNWKASYAGQMTEYHANKLAQKRSMAPTYRMFLLRTYTYLRDSKSKDFHHETFSRPASQLALLAIMEDRLSNMSTKKASNADEKGDPCGHCRRRGLGCNEEECKLQDLSSTMATKACKGLNFQACKKFVKKFKAAYAANPNGDVTNLVNAARTEAGASKMGD